MKRRKLSLAVIVILGLLGLARVKIWYPITSKNSCAAVPSLWIAGLPKLKKFLLPWPTLTRFFKNDSLSMRNYIINKIICLQYRLRKVIGKKMARWICIVVEKTFTTLFGRDVYQEEG